jgi:hypothetical protein
VLDDRLEAYPTNLFHINRFMLGEYKVNRCTRKCHVLNRPLREGEWYYSVVIADDENEDFLRRDYSAEAWQEPPPSAIGWWKNRMPTSDEKKLVLAPPEVLIDLLRQMAQFPDRAKSRYLLALMLMRKKLVRPADIEDEGETADHETTPEKTNTLRVEVIADGNTIDIPICQIGRGESDKLRDELNELLYCEAEPELDQDELDND